MATTTLPIALLRVRVERERGQGYTDHLSDTDVRALAAALGITEDQQ